MEVEDALQRAGGVTRRSAVTQTAAQRRALADAVRAGLVVEVGAWVALAATDDAVVLARSLNATITCVTAATYYGLAVVGQPTRIHVAVPRSRGARRQRHPWAVRGVVHRESMWRAPTPGSTVPLAPVLEALARILRCQPQRDAIVTVDSALNKGLVSTEELDRALVGPHSTRARRILDHCDGGSRSVIESLARLTLRAAGFAVRAGVQVSRVGEVDLLVEECVVVECDGFAYHSGREEYREDRRRDRELVAQGYIVLRFTYEEIMYFPEKVVEDVRRAILSARRAV